MFCLEKRINRRRFVLLDSHGEYILFRRPTIVLDWIVVAYKTNIERLLYLPLNIANMAFPQALSVKLLMLRGKDMIPAPSNPILPVIQIQSTLSGPSVSPVSQRSSTLFWLGCTLDRNGWQRDRSPSGVLVCQEHYLAALLLRPPLYSFHATERKPDPAEQCKYRDFCYLRFPPKSCVFVNIFLWHR